MQVLKTFIVAAPFNVFAFLSFALPERWCENPIHCEIGMFKAFGNF